MNDREKAVEFAQQTIADGLKQFIHRPLTPHAVVAIRDNVRNHLLRLSSEIGIIDNRDFWHVEVTPNSDTRAVSVNFVPRVLRGRNVVFTYDPDKNYIEAKDENLGVSAVGVSEFGAMVNLAMRMAYILDRSPK